MRNPTAQATAPGAQSVSSRAKHALSRVIARSTEAVLPQSAVNRLRASREWRRWTDSITYQTLADLTDAPWETKSRVFKHHVRRVEIETHAKCNRICSFCPNVLVDRRLNKTVMEIPVLERIFGELGSIDYAGQIVVARYSEPLANRQHLYECLSRARTAVPRAELCITTNTDYLTAQILDQLQALGLNTIYMSLYLRDREHWSLDLARTYTDRLQQKLGIERRLTGFETTTNVAATYEYKGMSLRSTCHNWGEYGTDRGGSLSQYKNTERVGPCRDPFETFVIDYNGSVVPCCAVRSDLPEHRDLVVGDVSAGTSIFDIYAGRLAAWRRSLVAFGRKDFPCATCRHRDLPVELVPVISNRLSRRLSDIGRAADYRPPAAPDDTHTHQGRAHVNQLYTIEQVVSKADENP